MANPYSPLFSGLNRSYNVPFGQQNGGPSFGLSFYSGIDKPLGEWQPITSTANGLRVDIGATQVSATLTSGSVTINNTSPIAVSGNFGSSASSVDLTGNSLAALDSLTGQIYQLQGSVNSLTGTVSSRWQKISTQGYSQYITVTGHSLISKIQGYCNITGNNTEEFIQVFDGLVQTGNPVQSIIAISRQNWFVDLAEGGVEFYNGLTVASSFDPVLTQTGDSCLFASVIYKYLP